MNDDVLDLLRRAWRLGLVSGRGPFVMFGRVYRTTEDLAASVDPDRLAVLVTEAEHGINRSILRDRFGLTADDVDEFWSWQFARCRARGFAIETRAESLLRSWLDAGTLDSDVSTWRAEVTADRVQRIDRSALVERARRLRVAQAARRVGLLFPDDLDLALAVADGSVTEADAMGGHPVTTEALVNAYDVAGEQHHHPNRWAALPDGFRVDWLAGTGLVAVFANGEPVAAWDHHHRQVEVPEVEVVAKVAMVEEVEPFDDRGLADRFKVEHPEAPDEVVEALRSGWYSEGQALIALTEDD